MIELGHTVDTLGLATIVSVTTLFIGYQGVRAYITLKQKELEIMVSLLQVMNRAAIEVQNLSDIIERKK